jgi:hypothetical protein
MVDWLSKVLQIIKLIKNIPKRILFYFIVTILIFGLFISIILFLPNKAIDAIGFTQANEVLGGLHGTIALACIVLLVTLQIFKRCDKKIMKEMIYDLSLNELNMLNKFRLYSENVLCLSSNEFVYSLEMKGIIIRVAEKDDGCICYHINNLYKKTIYECLEAHTEFKELCEFKESEIKNRK